MDEKPSVNPKADIGRADQMVLSGSTSKRQGEKKSNQSDETHHSAVAHSLECCCVVVRRVLLLNWGEGYRRVSFASLQVGNRTRTFETSTLKTEDRPEFFQLRRGASDKRIRGRGDDLLRKTSILQRSKSDQYDTNTPE